MNFFNNLLALSLEAAPWLVLGLVIGGLIKSLIPTTLLNKHLSGSGLSSIIKAALFGAPLPLCSCGVIPAALGLRRAGASKPATVSFLVSTPETGIDSVSISYALLGPFMAITRPIAAIVSAITAGLLVGRSEEKNLSVASSKLIEEGGCCGSEQKPEEKVSSCCGTQSATEPVDKETQTTSCCSSQVVASNNATTAEDETPTKEGGCCGSEQKPEEKVSSCCSTQSVTEPADKETQTTSCCSSQVVASNNATTAGEETPTKEGCCGSEQKPEEKVSSCCSTQSVTEHADKETQTTSCCSSQVDVSNNATAAIEETPTSCCSSSISSANTSDKKPNTFLQSAWDGIVYSFTDLFDKVLFWLVIGLVFAALVKTFIPVTFLAQWGSGLPAMLVMLVIGIPMYVCATASTPIAAGLLLAGLSPGVAMVYLMAGPATNISTLGVIGKELGQRSLIAYLAGVGVVALLTGFIVDYLVEVWNIDVQAQIAHSHEMLPAFIAWASLLLLVAVVAQLKYKKYLQK